MGDKTVPHPLYSPDLDPCHFWLFPKLKENLTGSRYVTIEETVTRVIDTLTQEDFQGGLPEVVGKVQQTHCSRRLLRRGLEFRACTINKSAHTKTMLVPKDLFVKKSQYFSNTLHVVALFPQSFTSVFLLCF